MIRNKRAIALLVLVVTVISLIPPLSMSVSAAYTISNGAVVIDEEFVAENGTEYIIENGVFSVTVIGNVNVSIIFDNVTIDRSKDTANTNIAGIYTAGQTLFNNGWTTRPVNNGYYVPTCPFLVTGGANVTARFDGNCTFRAGYNGWYATNNNSLKLTNSNHCGYAGIQVDSGSSLTISSAQNLEAYGAYQMALNDNNYVNAVLNRQTVKDSSGNIVTVGDGSFDIQDIIAYNSKPFKNGSYSTGGDGYGAPSGSSASTHCGGAGIGGGAAYNSTSSSGTGYTAGTPGTIIINTGTISAVGGHTAAGIGGGLNGAATSSKIEINGGNITAVAGRWSAAIGDGDSISGGTSTQFDISGGNSYEIIINGGTINAYGGLSSSAIGTTDEITSKGNKRNSALSITIAGGTITAQSGESYDGGTTSTAAIGAGNGTTMEDNSITIYNEANLVASSFSNYAVSNYGADTTGQMIPSVNIDPEGYVYLARFDNIATERIFEIYAIHKNANGHFIYVPTSAADIADGSLSSMTTPYYYALDPGHISSDGTRIGGFYLVDKDGSNVVPDDYESNPDNYLDEDTNRYYPKNIPAISAYYDTDTIVETIIVPGNYKAIAITLPKPADYGGAYVLEVPQTTGDPAYVLMTKDHPGVTSGRINYVSKTHYNAGANPPPESSCTPNIVIDGTARPFTDLDVGIYKDGVMQPTLIPGFVDTVYGYTFYVPNGTEKYWLNFSFDSLYRDEFGNNVSAKINLLSLDGKDITSSVGNSASISLSDLDIDESGKTNIWIKKTDTITSNGYTKTVSYKITIIVKEKYNFILSTSVLNKVYDGNPVEPRITSMTDGVGFSTKIEVGSLTNTYQQFDYGSDGKTANVSVNGYRVDYSIQSIDLNENNGTVTYTVGFTYNSRYTQTYSFTVDKNGNVTLGGGTVILGDFGNNYRIQISTNNGAIRLQLQRYYWYGGWSNNGTAAELKITTYVSHHRTSTPHDFSDIEAELRERIIANGTSSERATVSNYTESGIVNYEVSVGSVSDIYNVNYTGSGNAVVTVSYDEGKNHTSKLTQDDRDAIIYNFYEDSDGDGTYETLLGFDAPKNAGKYVVHAFLESQKYEAEGQALFEIRKKEINIVAIANWLKYITTNELITYNGVITEPGEIYFEGVVSGEQVSLEDGASFGYVDTGSAGYIDDVNYNDRKIKIVNPVLNSASRVNYILVDVVDGVCFVPGQIAYSTSGTMFRRAIGSDALWRKFYPVEETDYLNWVSNGGVFADKRVDYHSPVPNGATAANGYSGGSVGIHREYVKLRTTGDTGDRYSVDIEFGAMKFEFTKTIWNVNSGEYEAIEGESKWNGNNGINNAVKIINRSNSEIYYKVEFEINFMYAAISANADSGIRAALYNANGAVVAGSHDGTKITSTSGETATQRLSSAAPTDHSQIGTARSQTLELVMSGVPSSITESNNISYTSVGTITVTLLSP